MELHRLDGIPISGIDAVDIDGYEPETVNDIDFDMADDNGTNNDHIQTLAGLGYVKDPVITHEILDENGNIIYYADAYENIYEVDGLALSGFFKKIGRGLKKFSKKVVKPVVKTINRFVNPATILLRNGFLLGMKINMFKVAERLRFGYLSDDEARRRGMDMNGFAKLKKTVEKAQKIYEVAGGKSSNLRQAILNGKGNNDRAVPLSGFGLNGLGISPDIDPNSDFNDDFERFVVEADVEEVENFVGGLTSMDGLGAAGAAATTAASGVLATVAAQLSKIKGVFDQGKNIADTTKSIVDSSRGIIDNDQDITDAIRSFNPGVQPFEIPGPQEVSEAKKNEPGKNGEKSWASRNKIFLIGSGVLLTGGIAARLIYLQRKKKKKKKTSTAKPVNGLPKRRTYTKKSNTRAKKGNMLPKALL